MKVIIKMHSGEEITYTNVERVKDTDQYKNLIGDRPRFC